MPSETKCELCGSSTGVLIIDADGAFCSTCRQPKPPPPDPEEWPGLLVIGDADPGSVIPRGDPRVNGGIDGSIHRLRVAVRDFYGADEAEPAPDVLEARERELDAALRAWAQAGMPS